VNKSVSSLVLRVTALTLAAARAVAPATISRYLLPALGLRQGADIDRQPVSGAGAQAAANRLPEMELGHIL